MESNTIVRAEAPINIALVKYWGKVHDTLILPANDSLSITIDMAAMKTVTTVSMVDGPDSLVLNGKAAEITTRIANVIKTVKEMANKYGTGVDVSKGLQIESENNFATAAGLASSASGLSCLGFALAKLYGLPAEAVDPSVLARLGSGSACRSIYGGFVVWHKGWTGNVAELKNIELEKVAPNSIAKPLPLNDGVLDWWIENLSILICVVKPEEG